MFNDGVLYGISDGMGYPYNQPVTCGHILEVGDC